MAKSYKQQLGYPLCEKKSMITLSKNSIFQNKHIDTRYHFIREYILKKEA